MAKAKQILSGKIWSNRTAREVLYSILKIKNVDMGVLRITSADKSLDGDIGVARGIYLVGGAMRGRSTSGYEVIRLLLSLKEGQFQYLDFGDSFPKELDQDFKVRLTDVINVLPNLPERLEEITSKQTLNRIRSMNTEGPAPTEESMIDQKALSQIQDFERKSMRLRAAAFWATFVVVASLAAVLYYFQK